MSSYEGNAPQAQKKLKNLSERCIRSRFGVHQSGDRPKNRPESGRFTKAGKVSDFSARVGRNRIPVEVAAVLIFDRDTSGCKLRIG